MDYHSGDKITDLEIILDTQMNFSSHIECAVTRDCKILGVYPFIQYINK